MRDRIGAGELWTFSDSLVFVPSDKKRVGLTIGKMPIPLPGEKVDTEIRLGQPHMKFQLIPADRKVGMGWTYFGWEKLDKKLPTEVKKWMVLLTFDDIPQSVREQLR